MRKSSNAHTYRLLIVKDRSAVLLLKRFVQQQRDEIMGVGAKTVNPLFHRSSGGTSFNISANAVISSGVCDKWVRSVTAGLAARCRPGRHSRAGRTGRRSNPPPQ